MKNITAIFIALLFICGCTNDEAKQLQNKFNEEIEVNPQYKRGKKAKAAAAQYAEMEHNLNNKFVNDLSSMIEDSFEKQLEEFEDEELGFFSSYGYMWDYIFKNKQEWSEELALKTNKYFNNLDVEQEALLLYRNYVSEIKKLRSSFYTNKRSVKMPEDIYLDLPKETIDLGGMQNHTKNNLVIEFATKSLVTIFVLLIVIIIAVTIGWVLPGINLIIAIVAFVVQIILSIRNDNKVLDSLREQHTEITLDYETILNDLDKNTIEFYEKYR